MKCMMCGKSGSREDGVTVCSPGDDGGYICQRCWDSIRPETLEDRVRRLERKVEILELRAKTGTVVTNDRTVPLWSDNTPTVTCTVTDPQTSGYAPGTREDER